MLFRKKIPRSCLYCRFATQLAEGTILCAKKGSRSGDRPCCRFRYDPCKRIPPRAKALDFAKYEDADFSL